MSDEIKVEIKGLDNLQRALEGLAHNVAKRGVRQGLRAGATVIKADMVEQAPKDTGFMSEHIDIKTRMDKDLLAGSAFIGPNSKAVYPSRRIAKEIDRAMRTVKQYYAWVVAKFVEFGTSKMAAQPFMLNAAKSSEQKAVDAVITKLKDSLEGK